MKPIAVLTATYNHPGQLQELYRSQAEQNDPGFTWVIIDDGSGEETQKAIESFQSDGKLDILACRQENGGKSRAINRGLALLRGKTEFFVIVDDDERLLPDAVATVRRYVSEYRGTECGSIHFNRKDEKGAVIASPCFDHDFFLSYQEHKARGYHADGYLGYFTDKLGDDEFHVHSGEKYVAPSTLFMRVTRHAKLLWACAVLGETEYLEGGITKQGRRLRIRNPLGMIEYCELMQENGASLKNRIVYSVHGFAYAYLAKKRAGEAPPKPKLMGWTKPLGSLLGRRWEKQYR